MVVSPEYLATGYEDQTRSFFDGVTPVPPGTYLTFSIGGEALSSPEPYWWPERIQARCLKTGGCAVLFARR